MLSKRPVLSFRAKQDGVVASSEAQGELGKARPNMGDDLPLNFHPVAIRASAFLTCSQTLDQRRLEFSGFSQGGGLVTLPGFISAIGTLLPIAPCGRTSL